jgi:hypothetical protein
MIIVAIGIRLSVLHATATKCLETIVTAHTLIQYHHS